MNNKHRRSGSTAANMQLKSDFPHIWGYCTRNGIHDPSRQDLPCIAVAQCLTDKEFGRHLAKHARPAELAHITNAANLVNGGKGPSSTFKQLGLSMAEYAFVLIHAVQYGDKSTGAFKESSLMAMEAACLIQPVREATSFKIDYDAKHPMPQGDVVQTINKMMRVETYADDTSLLIYQPQFDDGKFTIVFFTQCCSTYGLWLGKSYRNSDVEYVVSARDLAILAEIESPLRDDKEFRAWLCQFWMLGISAYEKYMQPISKDEWRLLLKTHQPHNIDTRYLNHAANHPDMIAEYILARLSNLTLRAIEKLIAKMFHRRVKERSSLIDQVRILVSLFPNGVGSWNKRHENAEESEALKGQLRDVFIKANVLPQFTASSGGAA